MFRYERTLLFHVCLCRQACKSKESHRRYDIHGVRSIHLLTGDLATQPEVVRRCLSVVPWLALAYSCHIYPSVIGVPNLLEILL